MSKLTLSPLDLSPFAQRSPTLAHLNRLLATTSGTDKLMMIAAYSSHVILYCLRSKHFATKSRLDLALRIGKLGALIGDARVLYRLFGIFPIIGWAQSLNDPATRPKDKQLALIQRVQAWSMLIYYPLEHAYYLAGKGIWDISPERIGQLAKWSCRFWAAYVVLQFVHINRDYSLLKADRAELVAARGRKLKAEKVSEEDVVVEKKEVSRLRTKAEALKTDLLVQVGYLPLTMHWSLPNGLLPDQVYVGLFGTLAAAFGLQGAWRATA